MITADSHPTQNQNAPATDPPFAAGDSLAVFPSEPRCMRLPQVQRVIQTTAGLFLMANGTLHQVRLARPRGTPSLKPVGQGRLLGSGNETVLASAEKVECLAAANLPALPIDGSTVLSSVMSSERDEWVVFTDDWKLPLYRLRRGAWRCVDPDLLHGGIAAISSRLTTGAFLGGDSVLMASTRGLFVISLQRDMNGKTRCYPWRGYRRWQISSPRRLHQLQSNGWLIEAENRLDTATLADPANQLSLDLNEDGLDRTDRPLAWVNRLAGQDVFLLQSGRRQNSAPDRGYSLYEPGRGVLREDGDALAVVGHGDGIYAYDPDAQQLSFSTIHQEKPLWAVRVELDAAGVSPTQLPVGGVSGGLAFLVYRDAMFWIGECQL